MVVFLLFEGKLVFVQNVAKVIIKTYGRADRPPEGDSTERGTGASLNGTYFLSL